MRMPEAFVSVVGVEFGVGVTMVSAVTSYPPFDGTLNGASTQCGQDVLSG